MEEVMVNSLVEYIEYVEKLPYEFSLSRGQCQDFPLLPAALRLDTNNKRIYSNQAIEGFLEEFYNYSNMYIGEFSASYSYSKKDFQTMIWAQHYGLPTQLLDFSYSHLISLMFAVENSFSVTDPTDAVVWFLNPTELNYLSTRELSKEIKNISNPSVHRSDYEDNQMPAAVTCVKSNKRVQAQNGDFVYFKTSDCPLETYPGSEKYLRKVVIPKDNVRNVLTSLYRIGIRPSHLYPEITSVSKDILLRHAVKEASTNDE